MKRTAWAGAVLMVLLILGGCKDGKRAALPAPQEPSSQAIGYYCKMAMTEHDGPKGQIFVAGQAQPLWFSSVRDTLVYTRMESQANVAVIYVNDMDNTDGRHPKA
ncbi:MAG: nitrous oxide reductase accessory protein NosL, partial [Alphaproteobacteria bacterium]|nr:nitrous oxide reductase accessory protein NosL [Alphaproteobacteria bacterium]